MQGRGIEVVFGHELDQVSRDSDGIRVHCRNGDVADGFDCLLWAPGRTPNVAGLGLVSASVALDAKGFIAVDASLNTSAEIDYEIGAFNDYLALTPVAIHATRRFKDRVFGGPPDRTRCY